MNIPTNTNQLEGALHLTGRIARANMAVLGLLVGIGSSIESMGETLSRQEEETDDDVVQARDS